MEDKLELKPVIRCMLILILVGGISLFLAGIFALMDSTQATFIGRIICLLPPLVFAIHFYSSWTLKYSVYTLPVSIMIFFLLGGAVFSIGWLASLGEPAAEEFGAIGIGFAMIALPSLVVTFVISKFIAHRQQQDVNNKHSDSGQNPT